MLRFLLLLWARAIAEAEGQLNGMVHIRDSNKDWAVTLYAMMSESKTLPAKDVPVAYGPADTFKPAILTC